jgi:hypothetical protein
MPAAIVPPTLAPAQQMAYAGRSSDIFERNIIRYIIRYGGSTFTYSWTDEEGQPHEEIWKVIDFIGTELAGDNIEFKHPLYARVLQIAYDATADPEAPFDSLRFFTCHPDDQISRLALDLTADRNETTVENKEDLSVAIPRVLLELKECLVQMDIDDLSRQLRTNQGDIPSIMQRIMQLNEIKKYLGKCLGERTVTR